MLWTIGHSTRTAEEFLAIVQGHGIEHVIDVRKIPKSARHPHFQKEALSAMLARQGIDYTHMPGLGGLRKPLPSSINLGWRNDSFRGYADYMQTEEFVSHLDELIERSRGRPAAIMCAEAVEWRCHRSLIADALAARGIEVAHIRSATAVQAHRMTPFAEVEGTRVTYPFALTSEGG